MAAPDEPAVSDGAPPAQRTRALGELLLVSEAARQAAFDRDAALRRIAAGIEFALRKPEAAVDFNASFRWQTLSEDWREAVLQDIKLKRCILRSRELSAVAGRPPLTSWSFFGDDS